MNTLTFKTITTIDEAEKAWNTLSPNKVIYDDWKMRYAYYKYLNFPLFFYAAYDQDELVGLLPLMWNESKGFLDFFAGENYMEDNTVFVKEGYEEARTQLIEQLDRPAFLEYMNENMSGVKTTTFQDNSYRLSLVGLHSAQDYIDTYWISKSREKRLKQIAEITSRNVEIIYDNFEDLDLLIGFNQNRFGESSAFVRRPHWKEFHRDLKEIFQAHMVTIMIDGKKEAVGYALTYGKTYIGLNWGFNREISNLGKYLALMMIDQGAKLGMEIYEAGCQDDGWKEMFYFSKRPLYVLDLTPQKLGGETA